MRRFILETLLYIFLLVVILIGYDYYYYESGQFIEKMNGKEVYFSLRQSKTKHYRKKIMIGDSVGHQLFPSAQDNDTVAYMACNQAVTMAGMYFLLQNYIETNRDSLPTEAILLCTPDALHNDLDIYSFQYFLKPFKQSEYSKWTTPLLRERIHDVRLWWASELPFVRTSNFTTTYSLSHADYIQVSPLSAEYIIKMDSLLTANNIAFVMRSVPLKDIYQEKIDVALQASLQAGELPEHIYQPYIQSVSYMPSSAYVDHCHFTYEVLDTISRQQFCAPQHQQPNLRTLGREQK